MRRLEMLLAKRGLASGRRRFSVKFVANARSILKITSELFKELDLLSEILGFIIFSGNP